VALEVWPFGLWSALPARLRFRAVTALSYAIVTPARDEAGNLQRLAPCLVAQTRAPAAWLIVDDGSSDGTADLVKDLAADHAWVQLLSVPGEMLARGAPIVRAFHTALGVLDPLPDVVVKLDADISMDSEHFERLLDRFERDVALGIAGGIGYEEQADGVWRQRHGTGNAVWGACRAYRRDCLADILPLEEHMGWDTLDLMKATLKGWNVEVVYELGFRHHRAEGVRDGHRLRTARIQGEAAHFMGYRFSYLLVRTAYRAVRDPAAVGLLGGYASARLRRSPRCTDATLREYVRSQQSLRQLPLRVREALRPRIALAERSS
jgi:glycosyltransferase involved in cell wall biosynthesis